MTGDHFMAMREQEDHDMQPPSDAIDQAWYDYLIQRYGEDIARKVWNREMEEPMNDSNLIIT